MIYNCNDCRNEAPLTMPLLIPVVANRTTLAKVKKANLEGREHLVVPMVMLIADRVTSGSQGPVRYPRELLAKTAKAWNGKPVIVGHPELYEGGTADNPDVFNSRKVGVIFNARMDDDRLVADAYIDPDRLKVVDARILDSLARNEIIEVSTGLLIDFVVNEIEEKIANAIEPDHLAILPGSKGACDKEAGCGLLRNEIRYEEEPLQIPSMF
ncbi:DUF2213 domain-containing protein [Calycomorphotria hydatis]|uniref:Uncharacterized protein n=1 Tax=Calycomorphotria hydatis TaxID=2528027 RepID=A0A517TDC2_9PLAN|nr:DUF2213 domain-containing protein [Calycomorphotria hydatis]QDT66367.1 hypothetical protein V22_36330 [Calycomorphotria hydatis]